MHKQIETSTLLPSELVAQAKALLVQAKTAIVLLPPEPSNDQLATALGLSLTLESLGKSIQVGCSSPIKVDAAQFFGVDKIKTTIGNQNLIISFQFKEEDLKKVDYDIDANGRFQLLIQPQPGVQPPDSSSINYAYSGADADVVFTIGINSLEELGEIYAQEKSFLDKAKVINLNLGGKQPQFDCLNLQSLQSTSLSELTAFLLKNIDFAPTADAATNLLGSISNLSSKFQSPRTSADTFEAVAFLLRAGGTLGGSSLSTSSRFGAFPPSFPNYPAPTFADSADDGDFDAPPIVRPNRGAPKDWKQPKIFKPNADTSNR